MEDVRKLIQTRKNGVSKLDIRAAESKIGAAFPDQYKQLFQLVNNAEIGEWILFPIKDQYDIPKTWDDVVRQNLDVMDEEMPPDLIAIAEDGTGNKLCFRVNDGNMEDPIYIWLHETNEVEQISPSLKDFIIQSSEEEKSEEDE